MPASSSRLIIRCAEEMKRQNQITGFVESFAAHEGYAIWNKAFIKEQSYQNFGAGEDTLVFIPLLVENGAMVNGFLLFRVNGDIETHLYRSNDYDRFPYESVNSQYLTPEKIVMMLVRLDASIFGSRKFHITDSSLFRIYNNLPLATEGSRKALEYNGDGFDICWVLWHCTSPNGNCTGNGGCDFCPQCVDWFCEHIGGGVSGGGGGLPEPEWPEDPPGEPGGGAGGPPAPDPGNCTGSTNCGNRSLIIEGRLPCGDCGPGPILIPPVLPITDPCDDAKQAAKIMDSLYIKGRVDSVLATLSISTGLLEKGFAVTKMKNVDSQNPSIFNFNNYKCSSVNTGTDSSVVINISFTSYREYIAGFIHTHPHTGYAAQSAADIYELILTRSGNKHLEGNIVAAFNGDQYALTITDTLAATIFYNTKSQYLSGRSWILDSDIWKAFDNAEKYYLGQYKDKPNKSNLAYEMAMAVVLKEYNAGVVLHKKNSTGHFQPLMINTLTPDPVKPNKKVYLQDCL